MSATPAAFNPGLDGPANYLATDGTYVYVGGSFNNVGPVLARKVVKLTATGQVVTKTGTSTPLGHFPLRPCQQPGANQPTWVT